VGQKIVNLLKCKKISTPTKSEVSREKKISIWVKSEIKLEIFNLHIIWILVNMFYSIFFKSVFDKTCFLISKKMRIIRLKLILPSMDESYRNNHIQKQCRIVKNTCLLEQSTRYRIDQLAHQSDFQT